MPRGFAFFSLAALQLILSVQAPAQTVPIPESIRAEGVPPVPASLAAALNRYQNIRSAGFQDWDDAKGRAVYVTTRFADTPQVHHVAVPGAARRQLTFFLTVTDFGGGAGIIVSHAVARSRCLSWNSLQGNKLNAPIFRQPTTVQ
jgi:hypothetical protein